MPARVATLDARPGTYILWLWLAETQRLRIGRLGSAVFAPGHYAYVGSAFGPGGVRARLGHHLVVARNRRWHIDYLRAACEVRGAWICYAEHRYEHLWAEALSAISGGEFPLHGFGSSDCDCKTHLVHFKRLPRMASFIRRLAEPVPPVVQFSPDL